MAKQPAFIGRNRVYVITKWNIDSFSIFIDTLLNYISLAQPLLCIKIKFLLDPESILLSILECPNEAAKLMNCNLRAFISPTAFYKVSETVILPFALYLSFTLLNHANKKSNVFSTLIFLKEGSDMLNLSITPQNLFALKNDFFSVMQNLVNLIACLESFRRVLWFKFLSSVE